MFSEVLIESGKTLKMMFTVGMDVLMLLPVQALNLVLASTKMQVRTEANSL